MPLLMLLPVLGAALILSRKLKLSDSLAILCAVSGILVGVYLGALTGFLQVSVYALTTICVLLLLWEIHRNIKEKTFPFSFPLLLFLVLPVLYWLVHAESKPMFWDEYSHWGIYIREMADTHQLYGAETNAAHPHYPPGAPLWQYFFTLLPGYSEGSVYLAHFVLLITPVLVLFERINVRQCFWVPALLSLLALGLANFGHGIVSLYTEHILSVWYAGVMLQALNSDKTRLLEIVLLSMPLSVILLIKDAGLPLVASAVFLIICLLFYRNFREKKTFTLKRTILITIIFLVLIPLIVQGAWKINRSLNEVYVPSEDTRLVLAILAGESSFSELEMQNYRQHFWDVIIDQQLSKNSLTQNYNAYGYRLKKLFNDSLKMTPIYFIIFYTLFFIIIISLKFFHDRFEIFILFFCGFITYIFHTLIMFLTYPLIYSPDYAINLGSFLRFFHIVTLPLFIFSITIISPAFNTSNSKFGIQISQKIFINFNSLLFGIVLILLFFFETPYLKHFYTTASIENHPNNMALQWSHFTQNITEKMRARLNKASVWIHLPISDNGLYATQIRYYLSPIRTRIDTTRNLYDRRSGDLARLWDGYDYLWFPVINPNQDRLFFEKMGKKIPQSRFVKVIKLEKYIELYPVYMD